MQGESSLVVNALLGDLLTPRGHSYTLVRLLQGMRGPNLNARLFAPLERWNQVSTGLPTVTGGFARIVDRKLPYRFLSSYLMRRAEHRLLARVQGRRGDLVFTWGEVSLDVSRTLRDRGVPVVREKFNCAKFTAKHILDRAYASLGSSPTHTITQALIDKEQEELGLADAVFCPSPMVRKSLMDLGLPEERLISTSYGWDPARFAGAEPALPRVAGPTLIFVGHACVRKGAHILLEAWKKANITGRLVLVGGMEPLIAERYSDVLSRPDVLYVRYTENIAAYYRSADWFIFPTLEEGSPLVTYEAAGNGLPVIVSPMGAGGFARHNIDGLIIDSESPSSWADAITALPDLDVQRLRFAENARIRAMEFTFDRVGGRRRDMLLKRFSHGSLSDLGALAGK